MALEALDLGAAVVVVLESSRQISQGRVDKCILTSIVWPTNLVQLEVVDAAHENLTVRVQRGRVHRARDVHLLDLIQTEIQRPVLLTHKAVRTYKCSVHMQEFTLIPYRKNIGVIREPLGVAEDDFLAGGDGENPGGPGQLDAADGDAHLDLARLLTAAGVPRAERLGERGINRFRGLFSTFDMARTW